MIRFLIRVLKVFGWSVASIVVALLLAFLYYDVTEFQSRRDEISHLIAEAQPAERHPPAMLRKLLLTQHRGDPSHWASRLLLYRLVLENDARISNLDWHRTSFLWAQFVRLHLSRDEQLAIICSRSFLGRRAFGYEAAAHSFFQRPLERLTEKELALLVVFSRSPNRWDHRVEGRARLIEARDSLIRRSLGQK